MDLYMTSAEPAGLTLQEMIDCDIKSGVEFESDPLLGSFDFPPGVGSGLESEFEFKAFEPLFDPLLHTGDDELMDSTGNVGGSDHSPIASWMNLSSMANFNLDIETSLMVNPSLVLPSPHHPNNKKTHVLPSPSITSTSSTLSETSVVDVVSESQPSPVTTQVVLRTSGGNQSSPIVSSDINGFTATSTRPNNVSTFNSVSGAHSQYRHIVTTTSTSGGPHSPGITAGVALQSSTISYTPSRSKPLPRYRRERTPEEKSYPKPAYSYACLIALALKNSLTGSLPVSEIYNFMCEHFPYFRTAPNGWKNSVRHNLSLNKCFEKIEKPVVSGSNQRKGCLWALNPLKMHKMDEEVQKWSKKDLQGIKDAMTRPEVLESLERGEMKFEATSGASSCSEDSEEDEDVGDVVSNHAAAMLHHPPIKVISSSTSLNLPAQSRILQPNGSKMRISSPHETSTFFPGLKGAAFTRQLLQSTSSSSSADSPEPEYILPDSTLPEINIQSNGSLVDDLGNEITVEGDLGSLLNPRTVTTTSLSAGNGATNLILKKVNAAAAAGSPLRQSFVYATSAAGLGPHQNGVSRLVLTNAKLS